ncbi:tetratricopeptide repeat protein [Dyella acidiphila]|uniref:Tetratricopeptide repeat protein n=1 Tax=Dyella acidiphila TaxID=2775866 RepID=A0ABR9GF87_9GAMM|nr:tetratricopeptide repeat protein [Dyella acidiphila]MBE1162724.1 tetratricopeptide repeat protein [Dyella acidiphila]
MNRASQLAVFADSDPQNPDRLCDLLDEWLVAGNIEQALARIHAAPSSLQQLPGVRFRQARCALVRGDRKEAIELLQALLAGGEASFGVVHDLAYAQFADGTLDTALQTLAHVSAHGEDASVLALLKARILHRQQRFEAAIEALAPVQAGARLPEAQGLRALLWLDLGDTERASAEAERALGVDPDQHEAGIVRGTVALWSQRGEASTEAFEHVLATHPDSGRAWLGLGQDAMLRGDVARARSLLERASVQMPEHLGTWHALAWCQLLQGDLSGARRSFDKAFALDRTFGETHGGFALVHALRGERQEAQESVKRATRLDPQGRSARYAQSVLLLDEGRVEEARAVIDNIVARTPGVGVLPADFVFRLRDLVRPRS